MARAARLFAVGHGQRAEDGVVVADLQTLLKQKAATLALPTLDAELGDPPKLAQVAREKLACLIPS